MWLPGVPRGEEGGDERWLITYADMITLLLVLFIILYSSANADLEKFLDLGVSDLNLPDQVFLAIERAQETVGKTLHITDIHRILLHAVLKGIQIEQFS